MSPNLQLIAQRHGVATDIIDIEARFTQPTDTGDIEGVAVRFNVVDTYRTEFAATAFASIEGRSIPMLWSHNAREVIGSWSGFQVRSDGLTVKGKLNLAVAKAQEVRALLSAGDVSGLSIGFSTLKDERRTNGVRRITEARLHEISIVAFPAVPGSGITAVRNDASAFTRAVTGAVASLRRKD